MYVDPKQTIVGIPALRVRDCIRIADGGAAFDVEFFAHRLHVSKAMTAGLVRELIRRGYRSCVTIIR
jgi:hypothetical protein